MGQRLHPSPHDATLLVLTAPLTAAAQLNSPLDESISALEWATRERECHCHCLAAELAALRDDVGRPAMGFFITGPKVREVERPEDGGDTANGLASLAEHIDEVPVGTRKCPGDRGDPSAGIHPAE